MPNMKLKPLNRRESGKILEKIGEQFGCDAKSLMIEKYSFFLSNKDKVYIINQEFKKINTEKLNIHSIGIYFCELNTNKKDEKIRLSIEGSQIIGKIATKNVLELDDENAKKWMKGEDLECSPEKDGFVIIKNKNDFLGCGKCSNGKLFNYIPKIRRIRSSD